MAHYESFMYCKPAGEGLDQPLSDKAQKDKIIPHDTAWMRGSQQHVLSTSQMWSQGRA